MKQSTTGNFNWWKAFRDIYKETICLDVDMIFTHDPVNGSLLARRFSYKCTVPVTFKGHTADKVITVSSLI